MTPATQTAARSFSHRPLRTLLAGFAFPCALLALPPAVRAAEVTVSTGASLRDQMNALANGGTVSFSGEGLDNALSSVITLTSDPYVLNPGGAEHVTISGRPNVGVFANATGDINLTVSNITFNKAVGSVIRASAGNVNLVLAGDGTTEFRNNGPANAAPGNHGAAIYGHTGVSITGSQGNLSITDNYSDSRAGALYSETGGVTIDTVITGAFLLAKNSSPYTGGAILAQGGGGSAGLITLTGTYGGILISGNFTHNRNGGTGAGGALAANGLITINPYVLDTFLVTSNSSVTSGGAINANGALDITANGPAGIRFENNIAVTKGGAIYSGGDWSAITANSAAGIHFENNTAGGQGGAIFINRSTPLTLDAAGGDIVFQGNTQGAAKTPNAIHGAGAGGNTLNITGARDVLFFDPVFAASDAGSLNKTGAGSVLFSGTSIWHGAATISAGALLVNDGALLDTTADGKNLTLAPGAILGTYSAAGSGAIKAGSLTLSGILHATGTSQLHIHGAATLNNITIRADLQPGNQSGQTIIHDAATFAGAGIVDLWTVAAASGTFDVFRYEAGAIASGAFSSTLYYQGNVVGASGATARMSGSVTLSDDGKSVRVILPGVESNYVTWSGAANPSWDLTTGNWKIENIDGATTAIGDCVTFDDTAASRDVTIEGARLDVSGMTVDNTLDYTFAGSGGVQATEASIGGNIIAPGGAGIGKLTKDGSGKLIFTNASANNFEKGIDWKNGVISITNGNQLGVGSGAAINILAASGTLQSAGETASVLASDIAFAPGDARTLAVENTGATLDFTGIISGDGNLVLTGAGLTALSGANTFAGSVTLRDGSALAIASDEALGRSANTLVVDGDTRLVATGSFATARTIDIGSHTLEISTTPGNELALNGSAAQLTGSGTIKLTGQLHAAAANVLGPATNWDIAPGGHLALTASQSIANLRNAGAIEFRARGAVLNAASLTGGGAIAMDIDLNGGASNSRLVIAGQADGRYTIDITTIGDPGEPRAVDIPLVTFASGAATFSSNTISDGMNAYEARQNGGNVNLVFAGNSASADVILITAGALGMDWNYSLDSLRLRLGEVRSLASPNTLTTGVGNMRGAMGDIWFRTSVYRVEIDPVVVGAAFDQTSYDINGGVDRAFALEKCTLLAGAFATMTRTSRDHAISSSKSNSDGIGGGLYASWLSKGGWYLDAVAKYHRYENTIDANNDDRRVTRAEYSSNAIGGSIELGRRLAKKRLWLEPSLQAALGWFGSGEYTATSTSGKSMRIRVESATSLQARAQIRAGADFGRWQPHLRAGGVRVQSGGGTLHADPYEYKPGFSGWRLEAGAGATLMVDERTLVYFDYEYNKASNYRRPWAVSLGIRRTW